MKWAFQLQSLTQLIRIIGTMHAKAYKTAVSYEAVVQLAATGVPIGAETYYCSRVLCQHAYRA